MRQIACSYSALRFLPYRETGEFANVGVVVWAPAAGYFGHKINMNLGKRIRGFYPDLEKSLYRDALKGTRSFLKEVQQQFSRPVVVNEERHDTLVNRFQELVRTREGLMTFGPSGALLADSPAQALETLYQRLVLRQFTKHPEYQEVVMKRRLADCLRTWKLMEFYQPEVKVGDDRFHVTVTFAHIVGDRPTKVLKPLDLDKKDSTNVFNHGDRWVSAFRRLSEFQMLPQQVVIPVRLPVAGDRLEAATRVMRGLNEVGAQTIPIDDQEQLHRATVVA
jgi:hypothetical protein